MNLPWVGRLAYEAVKDERDRLRGQNEALLEQLVGLVRRQAGLRETSPGHRTPRATTGAPDELRELVGRWDSEVQQSQLWKQVGLLRARGYSWDSITKVVRQSMPLPDGSETGAPSTEPATKAP